MRKTDESTIITIRSLDGQSSNAWRGIGTVHSPVAYFYFKGEA